MQEHDIAMTLPDVADDVHFTAARTKARKLTAHLSQPLAGLVTEVDAAHDDHRKLRRQGTEADANVAAARSDAEEFCTELGKTLLGKARQDRTAPLFTKYFAKAPSALVAADGPELLGWLDTTAKTLAKEADKELKALAQPARDQHTAWSDAEKERKTVETANTQHDKTVRLPLRKKVNGARKNTHADLTKLAVANGKSKRWVDSHFRAARKAKKKAAAPGPEK